MARKIDYRRSFGPLPVGTTVVITSSALTYFNVHAIIREQRTSVARYPYYLTSMDGLPLGTFSADEIAVSEEHLLWATHPIKKGYSLIAYQMCRSYLENSEQKPPAAIVLLADQIELMTREVLNAPLLAGTYAPRFQEDNLTAIIVQGREIPVRNPAPLATYGKFIWEG